MKFRSKDKQNREPRYESETRKATTSTYYRPANSRAVPTEISKRSISRVLNKFTFSKIANYAIALIILSIVFFATTLAKSPEIQFAKGSYTYRTEAEYAVGAKEIMNNSLLNQSKLLFRSFRFEEAMRQKFPEISTINAIIPLGGRELTVSIDVSEPLAFVSNGQRTGVINDTGLLVTEGVSATDLLDVRFVTQQSNFDTGDRLLTSDEVDLLKLLSSEIPTINFIDNKKLSIKEILFNVGTGQLEISFENVEFKAKISTFNDSREQVGTLKASLNYLNRSGKLPNKYIDVRVPGRIFVL